MKLLKYAKKSFYVPTRRLDEDWTKNPIHMA